MLGDDDESGKYSTAGALFQAGLWKKMEEIKEKLERIQQQKKEPEQKDQRAVSPQPPSNAAEGADHVTSAQSDASKTPMSVTKEDVRPSRAPHSQDRRSQNSSPNSRSPCRGKSTPEATAHTRALFEELSRDDAIWAESAASKRYRQVARGPRHDERSPFEDTESVRRKHEPRSSSPRRRTTSGKEPEHTLTSSSGLPPHITMSPKKPDSPSKIHNRRLEGFIRFEQQVNLAAERKYRVMISPSKPSPKALGLVREGCSDGFGVAGGEAKKLATKTSTWNKPLSFTNKLAREGVEMGKRADSEELASSGLDRPFPHSSRSALANAEPLRKLERQSLELPKMDPRSITTTAIKEAPIPAKGFADREVSRSAMDGHMEHRTYQPLSSLRQKLAQANDFSFDWVTIGVVGSKTDLKTATSGKKFCILRLADLSGESVNRDGPLALNVDNPDKIMKIGVSADSIKCKWKDKDGTTCLTLVERNAAMVLGDPQADAAMKNTKKREHYTYILPGGHVVSTQGKQAQVQEPLGMGSNLVTPQLKDLLADGSKGARCVRAARGFQADKKSPSKFAFPSDAIQKLGFDPVTGKDAITAGGTLTPSKRKHMDESPSRKISRASKVRGAVANLLVLGVIFHIIYSWSIFDIYFRSPLVHGMTPVDPPLPAPAKRLVLFVADGLRADRIFENRMALSPFLRQVVLEKGSWGVSHTRVPTESRPGHVALIAGFYEDVSAVTRGWKTNPVEFDSLFNETRKTWSFGSPDILPMFAEGASDPNRVDMYMYPAESEDFAEEDEFFKNATSDQEVTKLLQSDKIVFFLHLLGLDTNGHAHRPYSKEYLDNIALVDRGIKAFVEKFESYFDNDGKTAYVFSADHGMHTRGNHGDGDPENTETPLIVWGAGVAGPNRTHTSGHIQEWGLRDIQRKDVNQADIAPLMGIASDVSGVQSTLIGVPYPMNSVGVLPLEYLENTDEYKAKAAFGNAKQILQQYLVKEESKRRTELSFVPFSPLLNHTKRMDEIQALIGAGHIELAEAKSMQMVQLCIDGLRYYQTYDWLFLRSIISAGYAGWIAYSLLFMVKTYGGITDVKPLPGSIPDGTMFIILFSIAIVNDTSYRLKQKEGLPLFNQVSSWILLGSCIGIPIWDTAKEGHHFLRRIVVIYLAFAPVFILLSLSYEALFYGLFSLLLISWLLLERRLYSFHSANPLSDDYKDVSKAPAKTQYRPIVSDDLRIAVFFLLFVNVAFFGTGNIASVSSFNLQSVYRFTTVFQPFLMAALLLMKIWVPFFLLSAVFGVLSRSLELPAFSLFLLVLSTTDVMTLNFFFLVRDSGSWLEIGTTISHFIIASAFIVFQIVLFSVGHLLVGKVLIPPISKGAKSQ
ncbi:Glycosyl phosphatidyl inositol anchor synthesis [Phlyctochytrium bullatum]|nr:Glycosyl phosphatidyl inositol anchor synthesis [Phlyctochytrium bullatum]